MTMRITSQSQLYNALQYLRSSQQTLAAAQAEVATGKRVRTVSDDPTDAGRIMRMDQTLRATEQFRRNASTVQTRLAVEEEVSATLRDLLGQARELAIATTADSPTDPTRQTALEQVRSILDQVIALGNTKVGNEHIFAGGPTETPPFLADGTYVGDSNARQVEVQEGLLIDTNHTGDALFGSAIQALQDLATELEFGTGASIQATSPALSAADVGVVASQAEVGLRQQELDWVGRHLTRSTNTTLDLRDSIEQVDPAESIVRFMAAQSALEQAREVISRVMQSSILDHM